MSHKRKTVHKKLRGGMFGIGPRAVRVGSTALKRAQLASFHPLASRKLPTGTLSSLATFRPGMEFSTSTPTFRSPRPVVGVGMLNKQEKGNVVSTGKSTTDKLMYSTVTFPILPAYTVQQILQIGNRSLLACYKKIFNKEPEFVFNNREEFLTGFFADLKNSGKLVSNATGIIPQELSPIVNVSPDATMLEGYEAGQTISPTTTAIAETLKKTAEAIPERIYPSTLQQQVNLFIDEFAPIKQISHIFLNKTNIANVSSFLSYEPSANVFRKANDDLFRIFRAAFHDGFDVNAFNALFTPMRILKLKTGVLNLWAKGDKQVAFQNLDKMILCVKYDVFTPMSLDGYLSTLNTKPSDALSELNRIYEESRKYERKIEEAPEIEKIKSKTWHWYKYTTQGKMAGIASVVILMCAMFGIYSIYDLQREAHAFSAQHNLSRKLDTALTEIQILGEAIQQKAIEPSLEVMKPATEPISKGYESLTEDARRRQYALLRWYNNLQGYMSKATKGGLRKTKKLRKI